MFDYMAGFADWIARGLPSEGTAADTPRAGDVARRDAPTCALTDLVGDARATMRAAHRDSCIVIDEDRIVLGRVRPATLEDAGGEATVETVMEAGPTSVRPSESLDALVGRMQQQDVGDILVTTPIGALVGVLHRADAERQLADHNGTS